MEGKLYGIGVGPGDPELLTLKALRIVKESAIIAVPGEEPRESVAYKIVKGAYPQLDEKELVAVPMPMTKDKKKLEESHEKGAAMIAEYLKAGKQVAFLTLGDPTVYSTYIYVHKRIQAMGYPLEIVSGIPSFCAVSARLNTGLVEKAEPLHVIPASYGVEEALELPGVKVLMKAGKTMGKVREKLEARGAICKMIENCGMEDEKVYESLAEMPDQAGYYSLIIVKEQEG